MRPSRIVLLSALPLLAACSAILGGPDLPDIALDDGGVQDATASDGSSGGGTEGAAPPDGSSSGSAESSTTADSSGSSSGAGSSGGMDSSAADGTSSSSGGDAAAPDTGGPDTGGPHTDAASDAPAESGSACGPCTGGMTCQGSTCACPTGTHDCSGTCDDDTSNDSCGSLCVPCSGGTTCQGGACQCPTGTHDCSGTCESNTSTSTCGSSCTACAAPPSGQGTATCNGTSCGISCNANWSPCGANCVNEQIDPANCNGCGITCPYGLCQAAACAASFFGAGHPNPGTAPHLSIGAGTLLGDQVTSGTNSSVVAIGAQTIEGGVHMRLALYTDASGKPGSALTETNDLTSVANGATEGAVPATAVVLGRPYWIMILAETSMHLATETPMVTWYYETGVTYGPVPASFSGASSLSTNFGDLYFVTAP